MKQVHMKTTLAFPKKIEEKQNQDIKCLHGTKTKELIAKNGSSIFFKMGFGVYGKIYRTRDDEEESFKIKKINKGALPWVLMYRTLTYQYYKRYKTKDERFLGLM